MINKNGKMKGGKSLLVFGIVLGFIVLLSTPYCLPLVAETLGPNNGSVTFTVDLRPNLANGNYNITRAIEIDPVIEGEQTWINYGQEDIGLIKVEEDNEDPSINIDNKKISSSDKGFFTGAIIGSGLFSKFGLFIVITICITLIVIITVTSKTILKIKKN